MIADLLQEDMPVADWGNKATRLNEIGRRCGLVVPPGICIRFIEASRITECQALASWLDVYQPTRVIIRTSSIREDTPVSAHAGRTLSVGNCPPDSEAILRILQNDIIPSVDPWHQDGRGLSFIIQEQVRASISGVAFATEERLWVECSRQSTHAVTSGLEPELRIEGSHQRMRAAGAISMSAPTIEITRILQRACRAVRNHFEFDIDMEWAWVAGSVFVLQVRPLTVRPDEAGAA
jgi:hypothetical protein